MYAAAKDELGKIYHSLTVTGRATSHNAKARWVCECVCGNTTEVSGENLRNGKVKSCGCYRKTGGYTTTHGHTRGGPTRTYRSWQAMHNRCYSPESISYKNYGALGITVCERWHKFENFLEDMGVRPENTSLGRDNSKVGYCKANCSWEDRHTQNSNTTRNRLFTHNGETKTLEQWCTLLGWKYPAAYYHLVLKGRDFAAYFLRKSATE